MLLERRDPRDLIAIAGEAPTFSLRIIDGELCGVGNLSPCMLAKWLIDFAKSENIRPPKEATSPTTGVTAVAFQMQDEKTVEAHLRIHWSGDRFDLEHDGALQIDVPARQFVAAAMNWANDDVEVKGWARAWAALTSPPAEINLLTIHSTKLENTEHAND